MKQEPRLDLNKVLAIIQPEGMLSRTIQGFEARVAQQSMMRNVIEAYENEAIALIEAGTGTGKSIAYLIPALLWAARTKERTLVSTHTISLQEQLIQKDIPVLLKALGIDLKAVLVKGMSNYVCLRKLEEATQILRVLPLEESEEIGKIEAWKGTTCDGSRSELPFVPSASTWEKVGAESDTCNHQQCPHYQNCFFMRARREAAEAHLLVVNHNMLCTDLSVRARADNYKDPSVLPMYHHIVLDEAHHLEDIATEHFASKVSYIGILRVLGRLASDKTGKSFGKLSFLKNMIETHYGIAPPANVAAILKTLNIDFPGLRTDLTVHLESTFHAYVNFTQVLQSIGRDEESSGENKLRLRAFHKTHPLWESEIVPRSQQLIGAFKRFVQSIISLEADLLLLEDKKFQEKSKSARFEMLALSNRLLEAASVFENFLNDKDQDNSVKWIEASTGTMSNAHLLHAELDMAAKLSEMLFSKFSTIILCSATLATNTQFDFIRSRLGITSDHLPDKHVITHIYDSPFDYKKQALFIVPSDLPNPAEREFTNQAVDAIWQAIQASRGSAFVLFTSYSMMKSCFYMLEERLKEHKYVGLKQGDAGRQVLLNTFKKTERAVLFGTDSFWEGVDVVGEALRCVIIVKLPFKVPSEPIIQARSEAISAKGGDPFMDYTLPQAIVKFKQGFGRLIRNKRDRGCVVCLDTRLLNKGYGKQFLNSLPKCDYVFTAKETLKDAMGEFYRRTHHLTK